MSYCCDRHQAQAVSQLGLSLRKQAVRDPEQALQDLRADNHKT